MPLIVLCSIKLGTVRWAAGEVRRYAARLNLT